MSNDKAIQLKKKRKAAKLTQKALAEKLGYKSASVIVRAEAGKLPDDKLDKLLAYFGNSYTVYTDGSCEINPGGRGGYGIVIIDDNTGEIEELKGGFESTTNNRMELMAVIVACEYLPDGATITLHSDSQYVVNTILGTYKRGKNLDLWARLDKAMDGKAVTPSWVRGHAGNEFNEVCDELAREGCLGELLIDEGYTGEKATVKKRQSSSDQLTDIPDEDAPVINDTYAFAMEHNISEDCAKKIREFYQKGERNFKAYLKLKCGIDSWSRRKKSDLSEILGKDAVDIIQMNIRSEKSVISALKWYARGLTIYDAIKKALVDEEVSLNAMQSRQRKPKQMSWRGRT